MTELVVHCKRSPYDIYIGRPGIWGNPYVIGRDGIREEAIAKYRRYLEGSPELMARLPELSGKILGCWCAPQPCHGDVLAELANAPQSRTQSLEDYLAWLEETPLDQLPPGEDVSGLMPPDPGKP